MKMAHTESPQVSPLDAPKTSDALAQLRIQRSDDDLRPSGWLRFGKIIIGLVFLLAFVVAGLVLASQQGWFALAQLITPRPEVRVAAVEVETGRSADAVVVATGYLESRRQAKIGAKAPGRIEVLHVEEGTRVFKGQVLAVLEHADLDAAITAAHAMLQRTKAELAEHEIQIQQNLREFERAKRLRELRSISEDQYDLDRAKYDVSVARRDTLKAAVALADARTQEAKQFKENMYVRAPFDGTVISKDAEVGESILPGGMGEASGRGSVVTIADLDHLEVDTDVKEDYISRIAIGQPAEVTVDAVPGRRYKGRVRKIIPMGDRARATIKVKVEILDPDQRLFPDMSSTVYFLPESSDDTSRSAEPAQRKVYCPSRAVQVDDTGQFIWLVDRDEQAQRVTVLTGPTRDGRVEIEQGLQGGERVIMDPPASLRGGQQVRIVQ